MKTALTNSKYLKYLFWLGPALIVMGLTAGLVAGSWGPLPLGLVTAGIIVIGLWLLSEGSSVQGFFGRRSTQASTNALIATLAVIVILGLINFLAVRYTTRIDLTENRLFTLAPQSQEVVQGLQQPVKVWIFDIAPSPLDRELLENYRRRSSQFSYEYVDPQAQPGIARRFGVRSPGEVYFESGQQRKLIQTVNAQERLSERKLTNGLAQTSSTTQAKIYFLQGHGERSPTAGQGGLSQAIAKLGEENYVSEPLNLAEATKVPEDAAVVVLAGPQRSLLEVEVKALEAYLQHRSGLMLLIDPQTKPELGDLLQKWGVRFSDRLIINPIVDPIQRAAGLSPAVALITRYSNHPITQEFGNGNSVYPIAQPIEVIPKEGVTATPLLLTSDRAQAQKIAADGQLQFDPKTDPQGSMLLGAALSQTVATKTPQADKTPSPEVSPSPSPGTEEPDTPPQARLVVVGNSTFATDGLFDQQLNGDVFLNSVSWLSQQDDQTLSIRPKELTNRRILLPPQQQILLLLGSVVFLPLIGFGMALGIWWKRR